MLTATTQFGVEVSGKAMTVAWELTMTLPGGDQDFTTSLVSASPDESTTSDMPSNTRYMVGYPSRQLDVVISDPDGIFDPANAASPLYGLQLHYLPVTWKEGLYLTTSQGDPELLARFTGTTRSWKRNPSAKTVSFTCLDNYNQLRSITSIPAVVTPAPYNAGLTSEYALDALLRAATNGAISSWPARRSQCVLAVGFRSSVWPEVGTLLPWPGDSGIAYAPGRNGSALQGSNTFAQVPYQFSQPLGTSLRVEFDAKIDPTASTTGVFFEAGNSSVDGFSPDSDDILFQLQPATNGLYCRSFLNHVAFGPDLRDGLEHHVVFLATLPAVGGSSVTVSAEVDGVTYSGGTFSRGGARGATAWDTVAISVGVGASIDSLIASTETAIAPSNSSFVPFAVLDPSLNTLQVIPAISGDPVQTISQIEAAESAVAGFDEKGIFRFKNRNTLRSGSSVRTITSSAMQPLQPESDASALYNHVTVGYTAWTFGAASTVWSLSTFWKIPPGRSSRTITTDGLVTALDATVAKLPDPSSGAVTGNAYYRASVDKAGTSDHPGITITPQQVSSNQIKLVFNNPHTVAAWLVSSADHTDIVAGTPTFWLGGIPVTPADEVTVDRQWPPVEADGSGGAAASSIGDVVYPISGNPWIQDEDSARALAVDTLAQLYRAPILIPNVQIDPDPRLQLGDRITLVDSVSGLNEPCIIFASEKELSLPSGEGESLTYTQTLDVRMVASRVNGWILGDAKRSQLSTTTKI